MLSPVKGFWVVLFLLSGSGDALSKCDVFPVRAKTEIKSLIAAGRTESMHVCPSGSSRVTACLPLLVHPVAKYMIFTAKSIHIGAANTHCSG